jgi:hypothetical protein
MWNRGGSPVWRIVERLFQRLALTGGTNALEFSICEVKWDRYPRVSGNAHAREWLEFQATRGLAANTIEAYGRGLDRYLGFLDTRNIPFHSVIRPTIGAYIQSIAVLAEPRVLKKGRRQEPLSRMPLCNNTSLWFVSFMTS